MVGQQPPSRGGGDRTRRRPDHGEGIDLAVALGIGLGEEVERVGDIEELDVRQGKEGDCSGRHENRCPTMPACWQKSSEHVD